MARTTKAHTQEMGLSIALILTRYFLKTDHLHYGYWSDGLSVEPGNFLEAQERYHEFLLSHLPADARTILEVGCGTGTLAEKLIARGYDVECVSPSPLLTQSARELIGAGPTIHECKFEHFRSDKMYDLIVFSESFQYVKLETLVPLTYRCLKPGGSLLVADFFSLPEHGKSPIGGGHELTKFRAMMAEQKYETVEDIDITAETAPTLDLAEDLIHKVLVPLQVIVSDHLRERYALLHRSARWLFRKKIAKLNAKYFSGTRNARAFSRHKSYRLMVFRKDSLIPAETKHAVTVSLVASK